ncbi:hypothetical protein [Desulforamulus hydrothermalis]|uniref:Uncharacterized protein n=1 Tax=Desulforamulus hydrothermalis Lam5 = DSM 18033 TaxID=1121428 RepID=K8DX42_9FIRM|nr:hypothetical protein [Desulforamulus hydrothermalis]CCO07069.1 conserved hypothetical protein [Desulforamulus hydrothermalis Lam5 = DSM 18033]SHH40614.1 hypothetical protein SAMN02745177_02443 [Desulforamulus hydrothermalis Lam5 = DSM 18033]
MTKNKKEIQPEKYEAKIYTLFATERMEDYAALSLALLIVIIVLMVHQ